MGRPLPGGASSFPLPCPPQPALLSPPLSRLLFPLTTLLPQAAGRSGLARPSAESVTENRALNYIETPPPVVPPWNAPFPPAGLTFFFFRSVCLSIRGAALRSCIRLAEPPRPPLSQRGSLPRLHYLPLASLPFPRWQHPPV